MRILYLADIRFPLERANGIQTMETCAALAERGHRVTLRVRPDTHQPARDPFTYFDVPHSSRFTIERQVVIGPSPLRRALFMVGALGASAGRRRTDVILTRDLGIASLLSRVPRGLRAPLAYESHGYAPAVSASLPTLLSEGPTPAPSKLRRLAAREARVWQHAEGYVTITAALASELRTRLGPRADVSVVPDGTRVPEASVQPQTTNASKDPIIGYAGHLYPWKGVDVLLEALALLPNVSGLIVGGHPAESDLSRLRAHATRLGLNGRVTFTGHVEPSQVAPLLRRATILVLPNRRTAVSEAYTSPLKLFEYLALAKPIVASDLPSLREVVVDGESARLVQPDEPSALAGGIRQLIDDPSLRATLAAAAHRLAPDYTWARRAERLEQVLHRAIDRGSSRP